MMSTIVPSVLMPDSILGNPFENGFTPWDCPELFPDITDPKPAGSSSGSDEPGESKPAGSDSGSDQLDERKKRRMISNRESARRSRMRKQKHLENLRNQVARLRVENRELTNRLRFVLYNCHGAKTENHRLRSEQTVLRQRLNRVQEIMMLRQLQQLTSAWPCNNTNNEINYDIDHYPSSNNNIIMRPTPMMMTTTTTSNEQIPTTTPSLIAS